MKKPDFKANELNMKGAYNAKRWLYKYGRNDQDRVIAKSDTTAEEKADEDNDLFTIRCGYGIITVNGKGVHIMNLENISTAQLVEELLKRDGVEKITVAPYEACTITVGDKKINDDGGPAVILRITD